MTDQPVAVKDVLRTALADFQEGVPCGRCRETFSIPKGVDPSTFECGDCKTAGRDAARREAEGMRILEKLEEVTNGALEQAGMAPRELRCRESLITAEVLAAIPVVALAALHQGLVPSRGFGLSGSFGSGKTGALAALVRSASSARIKRSAVSEGRGVLAQWVAWVSWPEFVNRIRVISTLDGGIGTVDASVAQAIDIPLLVLDDVGAERIKGSYIDDWAASQLDLVVDGRYRNERPTLFTTALDRDELIGKYGARLFSRLCGDNDLVVLRGLRDRRAVRKEG